MASNRNDFDDFFGDDDDTPVTDTRADGRLYRVPLTRLSPNLVNPRKDFGTEDALIDFGKSLQRRQNQACPVVSRNAYLKLWPEHRDQVKDVDYILVSGERRYRAANAVGLAVLDCIVNDDFAKDRKTFMEAVVSENVDRQNFDPIEEAYAVQALVTEFGTNRAVAQHFERVDGWVTQRILLTHLHPQMQDLVRQKKMPLEAARTLGKKARDHGWSADQQAAWLEEWQTGQLTAAQERKAVKQEKKAARQSVPASTVPETPPKPTPPPDPAPSFTAVKHPAPPEAEPDTAEEESEPTRPPQTRQQVPEPRTEPLPPGRPLPYDDGLTIGQHLVMKMEPEAFLNAAWVMVSQCWDKGGTDLSFALLSTMLDSAAQRDGARLRPLLKEFLTQIRQEAPDV